MIYVESAVHPYLTAKMGMLSFPDLRVSVEIIINRFTQHATFVRQNLVKHVISIHRS